jgi:hypothetical protein
MADNGLSFLEMLCTVEQANVAGELEGMPAYLKRALYDSVYATYDWWRYIKRRDVELMEKEDLGLSFETL